MSIIKKSLISFLIAGAVLIGFLVGLSYFNSSNKTLAGVNIGNEYKATTTDATWSTATAAGDCKDSLIDRKILGSVIVTKTSNAILNIYDATTTRAHSNHATTTLASFPLTTVGTYIFDVSATRGICVQVDNAVGYASTTITTRP